MERNNGNRDVVSEIKSSFNHIVSLLRESPPFSLSTSHINGLAGVINEEPRDKVRLPITSQETPSVITNISKSVRFIADKVTAPFHKSHNSTQLSTRTVNSTPSLSTSHHTLTHFNPSPKPPPQTKTPSRSYQKISQIRQDRHKGIITCFRCGEQNHLSRNCRNAIVCFECGRLGHRSSQCKAITSIPHSSFPLNNPKNSFPPIKNQSFSKMNKADEYAMLHFTSNDTNKAFQETIAKSVVIFDERQMGALYIQAHLEKRFLIQGFRWVARAIPNDRYLIDPPNLAWRATMIEFGELDLGGYRFTLEPYDLRKHDFIGHSPIPFWIRVTGLPYRFFKDEEFKRIADDLGGGILLDVDPRSGYHLDFCYLRLRIGVCDREVIPKYRKLKFTETNGTVTF
jgi:Domain of unknown function (DUF4283)/Zinc knuckle